MNILETLIKLRDDLKTWVANNLVALDAKIESKTIPIDSELDTESTNPVQNKAITKEINTINSEIAAINSNISDLEDATNDSIVDDGSGEFNIADPSGNVIFKVDAEGAHTTNLTLNGKDVKTTLDTIEANIDTVEIAIETLEAGVTANNTVIGELKNHTHDFNDLTNKPNITDDESGEFNLADPSGNIIFKVDANGAHTTNLMLNGKDVVVAINTAAAYIDELETKVDNVETAVDNLEAGVEAQAAAIGELKNHNHDYNELENAPAITDDESGEVVYADEAGNVIARIDANGIETTTVCAKDIKINGKSYTLHDHNSAYDVKGAADAVQSNLNTHTSNKSNPHGVTAAQIGASPTGHKHTKSDIADFPPIPSGVSEVAHQYAVSNSKDKISDVTTWNNIANPLTQRQRACVYGNGYYIVCGTSGEMAYSLDGVTWTSIPKFTQDVITGIAYGKGIFVAIDSGGLIWIAKETPYNWESLTVTWKLVGIGVTVILEGICYANNRFVLVGEPNLVAFSDDGRTWTETSVPYNFKAVTFGNGKYVGAGNGGAVSVSYDGENWTDYSDPSITGSYRAAAFGAGRYVIGCQAGIIRYSDDGRTWTTATTNSTSTVNYIRGIVYAEGKFYAVMYVSTGKGEIWVSEDAETWTVQQVTSGRLWCCAYGDGIILTSGDNGDVYALDLGIVWLTKQPELASGQYLWERIVFTLSDGGKVIGDSVCIKDASVASVNGKTGAVQLGAEDVGAAKKQAANDMLHNGNEFTFIPDGYEGQVYINHRTASGQTNGNVTNYYFGNGRGGLATFIAGYFKGKFQGETARPIYNNEEAAMLSDVPTKTETWTFTLEDGSTVTKAVYVGVVPMATITINGSAPRASIEVNGTAYTHLEEPLEVPIGTVITCIVGHSTSTSDDRSSLIVNGNYVYEGRDNGYFYEYTVVGNVTISVSGSDYSNCHMIITEQ